MSFHNWFEQNEHIDSFWQIGGLSKLKNQTLRTKMKFK